MQVFECQFCSEQIEYDDESGHMPGACNYCHHTAWRYLPEVDRLNESWFEYYQEDDKR
jgi:hypothetical protein